ncbi:MAG: hypothetical protein KJ971_04275 [Firmicutes bacterium]|nr:hypothetical protein [Bacillota bacterium]
MKDNASKKTYKKINSTFSRLNEQDEFSQLFLNLLKSGNTTLYQKERRERRIFDDSWLDSVEKAVPVIDKLTRNPRESLKKVRVVVPVEQAKKTDKETIRHLAANTQFIKNVNSKGEVTPSQVLTSYTDSDFGTYENRFLMTLVDKLFIFIEKRYDLIVKKMHTEYVNYLNLKSEVFFNDATLDYDITLKINQTLPSDEVDKQNQELFDRMTKVRTNITYFKMSTFMKAMKEFAPVTPPIMKTNIIMKDIDFRQCYSLWVLMDQIDRVGYDVDIFERDIDFDQEYIGQINNALLMLYTTFASQQSEDFGINQDVPFDYKRIKAPKITKQNLSDVYLQPGYLEFENNHLNQYYLDQIRKSNYARFKTLSEAGISFEEAIDIIFKQIVDISNAVYEDYIKFMFNPENEPNLTDKISTQEKILNVYRQIENIKQDDIRQLKTNKAVALLNLRNYRDELKRIQAIEKAERERLLEEERLRKEEEKKQKQKEELALKKKIERAEKLLRIARKKRLVKAFEKAKRELEAAED